MRAVLIVLLLFPAHPVPAQDEGRGRDLMSEALRLFMRGLMQEMEPALEGMEELLDSLDAYHPPEVLPNGDIIIRRKRPEAPDGEIEL